MSRVLVVDDSEVDRSLVGGLLQEDLEVEIAYATDGEDALRQVEEALPDLVLTDLVMPGTDGLALVAELKEKHPFVPVILVTSKGSEEIAVRALKVGAASYVPKHSLAEELVETVEMALSAVAQRRGRSELMKAMRRSETVFEIGNDRSLFTPLISYLQEAIAALGVLDEGERTRVGVALEEALVNASEHGNLGLDSTLRQDDRAGYLDLVQERRQTSPYSDRRIFVEAALTVEEARIVIRDEGEGFDWHDLPDPTDPQNLLKVSGRGVMLMRTFMDEVSFNEAGNEVTMVKRPPGDEDSSG